MVAFLENLDPQFLLLLVAGIIWAITKVVSAAQGVRHRTRMKVERQERQRRLEFDEKSEYMAPKPAPTLQTPVPTTTPVPPRTVRKTPIRRPPRQKQKRVVRRRVIRRTVRKRKAAPQAPVALRERLRDVRSLRDAIVLREILGPPKALRGRWIR